MNTESSYLDWTDSDNSTIFMSPEEYDPPLDGTEFASITGDKSLSHAEEVECERAAQYGQVVAAFNNLRSGDAEELAKTLQVLYSFIRKYTRTSILDIFTHSRALPAREADFGEADINVKNVATYLLRNQDNFLQQIRSAIYNKGTFTIKKLRTKKPR
jgi:hypothetical protein